MRRIYADIKITNYEDLAATAKGIIKLEEIRSISLKGRIDTGSTSLVIPKKIFRDLGLREIGEIEVKYANKRKVKRLKASGVIIKIEGRETLRFPIVEEESEVLIGNPILEDLDLIIDPKTGKLAPRYPEFFEEL